MSEPVLVKLSGVISMRRNAFTYCLHRIQMKLKPFLDSFQGCFKDNCRCFAGFFFLYRILILLPIIFAGDVATCYLIADIFLFLILFLHCIFRPFQNKWHNYLDLFLLTNLLLVNTLTISNYYITVWDSDKSSDSIAASQAVLIAMPLVLCVIMLLGKCFYGSLLPYLGKNERLQTFFIRVTSYTIET